MKKKVLYSLVLPVAMTVILTACGKAEEPSTVKLDSGVINENYQGVAKPVVEKKLKLSNEELINGIQKVPLKSSAGQSLTPEIQVNSATGEDRGNGDNAAKPQI